jgi:carboxyl-terminal processing protease
MNGRNGAYEEIMNVPFDYSIDESFNTDYDKAPYAKNTAELKDGESRLNCRHFPLLTERLSSRKKQNKSLEGQSEKDTLDALKSANELMADNGEKKIKADAAIVIELNL